MSVNDNGQPSVRLEARAWLIKLQSGEASDDLRAEFQRWCAESDENMAAYDLELVNYDALERIKSSPEFGSQGNWREPSAFGWQKFGAVAAAVAAAIFVIMAVTRTQPVPQHDASAVSYAFTPFSTRHGEIRAFRLSDGSTATLDTNSKVEVSITNEKRLLRLAQGRARFEVASGEQPFTVQAGTGEVVATTGSFDLAYDGQERVTVQLLTGNAFVRPTAQFASYTAQAENLVVQTPFAYRSRDFSKLAATGMDKPVTGRNWPSGWVEYDSIRLADLVLQANRYAAKPIRLGDPETGALKISGRFRISDTEAFIARACELFELRAVMEKDAIYLRRP